MPRRTRARIDLAALRANFRRARQLAPEARSMAVVKADGYGHGLEQVATTLAPLSETLAVATLDEAERIRACGIDAPVVLLEGVHEPGDWSVCFSQGFEPVIHSEHQFRGADRFSAANALPVWLKCNTGMNRLGVGPDEVDAFISRIQRLSGLRLCGLMTHYACADDLDDPTTGIQAARLREIVAAHPGLITSAANSAAHFHEASHHFDLTRPGIMLYGGTPLLGRRGPDLGLRPVMKLESTVIAVRDIVAGESVGYGGTWTAPQATRMGIVEIGYGDGYPRHAPNGTPVAVNGVRCPLIGRVSMDMLAVDLSPCPRARPGAEVELWGETVSVDEVAELCETISYELLTGVLPRVPRTY